LCDHNLEKPPYEKEMMAILHTMGTWNPYLIGRNFHINIDHHSLKYFLEQWLSSLEKHKWLTKILGYYYKIIYKNGKENVVFDALSRIFEEDMSLFSLSSPSPRWIDEAQKEWIENDTLRKLVQWPPLEPNPPKFSYTWKQDTLWYKGHIFLEKYSTLKQQILTSIVSHSGFHKTYEITKHSFF